MIPFLTFREPDRENNMQYYILQKSYPHFKGRLVTSPISGSASCQPIAGYNLWVNCEGTIIGNMVPGYRNVKLEIESVIHMMTDWFYAERILKDEKRYKKFKL